MTALLVVATVVVFLGVDMALERSRKRKAALGKALPGIPHRPPLQIPEGIFFAKSHTWLHLFSSGKVRIGVDDFVAGLLESAQVTLLKNEGDRVAQGDPLLVLARDNRSLTVRAPIAGRILMRNRELERSAGLRRERLFSDGWAYAIEPDRPEELRKMMLGKETRAWMSEELGRLRDLFAGAAAGGLSPAAVQDGGIPVPSSLADSGPEVWRRFEREFLRV